MWLSMFGVRAVRRGRQVVLFRSHSLRWRLWAAGVVFREDRRCGVLAFRGVLLWVWDKVLRWGVWRG